MGFVKLSSLTTRRLLASGNELWYITTRSQDVKTDRYITFTFIYKAMKLNVICLSCYAYHEFHVCHNCHGHHIMYVYSESLQYDGVPCAVTKRYDINDIWNDVKAPACTFN